jgi:hypothetical protein
MDNNYNNLANEETLKDTPKKLTGMPKDFWQLVKQERARALAQIEKRKQKVFQPFGKQENTAFVPMPENFWDVLTEDVEERDTTLLDIFEKKIETTPQNSTKDKNDQIADTIVLIENSHNEGENTKQEIENQRLENSSPDRLDREEDVYNSVSAMQENEIIYLEQESAGFSFKEAAQVILDRERRPMTAREIAEFAIKERLVLSKGKTPHASIISQISTDIRRNPNSPFVSIGSCTYALKNFYFAENSGKQVSRENSSQAFKFEENVAGKGTVISGNFAKHEERQATSNTELDSNLASQTKAVESNSLVENIEKVSNQQTSNQGNLIEKQLDVVENTEIREDSTSITAIESRKMTFKQASFYLLERLKRPMNTNELADLIAKEGLVVSNSKNASASVAGQLYTDLEKYGEKSVFRLVAPRTFGLADWYKKNED